MHIVCLCDILKELTKYCYLEYSYKLYWFRIMTIVGSFVESSHVYSHQVSSVRHELPPIKCACSSIRWLLITPKIIVPPLYLWRYLARFVIFVVCRLYSSVGILTSFFQ